MNYKIIGGAKLFGNVKLSGFKHSTIPIIASSLLTDEKIKISNVPRIKDVFILCDILKLLGGKVSFRDHRLAICMKDVSDTELPEELVSSIRGSIYLLPGLLTRNGRVKIRRPGGCKIGIRPIVNIAYVLRQLGAKIKFGKLIEAYIDKFKGNRIVLNFPGKYLSGATKTGIIAGVLAKNRTVIENACKGYEIVDLARFLKTLGAHIKGEGTNKIIINGVNYLSRGNYSVISDLIEMGTFIGATAITQSTITIKNVAPLEYIRTEAETFRRMGIKFEKKNSTLKVFCDKRPKATKIKTEPYPGLSTDLQPIFSAVMSISNGKSIVYENFWEDRFAYVRELKKMGAKISINGNKLSIKGVKKLYGKHISAPDLRGAASLVLAGLSAEGTTVISNAEYLNGGYETFNKKLKKLHANINIECD